MKSIKRFFLTTTLFLFICSDFQGQREPEPTPKFMTRINMIGRLVQPNTRSRQTFTVFQNCNSLQVTFIRTLGVVDVVVLSSDSAIYRNRVQATTGSIVAIETSAWKEGKYVIDVCEYAKRQCANGDFMIEDQTKNHTP